MNKKELFEKVYEAVVLESELEQFELEFELSNDIDDHALEVKVKAYRDACEKSDELFRELEKAELLKEYMEWAYKKDFGGR